MIDNITTYENGSNLLPHQCGRCVNIIIGQEVQGVLHVLEPKCQADTHAEWTMIINVHLWELRTYDSNAIKKRGTVLSQPLQMLHELLQHEVHVPFSLSQRCSFSAR